MDLGHWKLKIVLEADGVEISVGMGLDDLMHVKDDYQVTVIPENEVEARGKIPLYVLNEASLVNELLNDTKKDMFEAIAEIIDRWLRQRRMYGF